MSEENVELVRRSYQEFADRGEPPWELIAPDAEFDSSDVMPDIGVIRGQESAKPAMRSYVGAFEDFHIELEEVIGADEDHVVTMVRDGGRVRGSDAEIWNRFFHAFTIRGGRIVRWSSHVEKRRALEAAGLSE